MKYTYKQAFDKTTEAYIKGEIQPYKCKFCFCGTLSPDHKWFLKPINDSSLTMYPYTISEYRDMEWALLNTIDKERSKDRSPDWVLPIMSHPGFEEFLFKGMCAALDVLKQIHIERGEIIDEEITFIKREKQLA